MFNLRGNLFQLLFLLISFTYVTVIKGICFGFLQIQKEKERKKKKAQDRYLYGGFNMQLLWQALMNTGKPNTLTGSLSIQTPVMEFEEGSSWSWKYKEMKE